MDPLTALSVAGTIVQFADFGCKVLSEGRELYASTQGTLVANDELELATADLRALVVKIELSSHSELTISSLEKDEEQTHQQFQKICNEAIKLADEIIKRLDKLKVKGSGARVWKRVRKAIESAWSKNEITSMTQRLKSFKEAMETLFCIRCPSYCLVHLYEFTLTFSEKN
jgi:hypothetical protein